MTLVIVTSFVYFGCYEVTGGNRQKFSDLEECTESILHSLGVYIKLFLLFSADDAVIITENVESLQRALDVFSLYCNGWKLSVNTSKTRAR